ncbi:unnamed protein product [Paramecium sonneborni]|uniref:Uncharacterized protein n=1 Tax=Paramecium sonneborni TaxID=65129 RepID=A0A8S1MRY4_9CILI|nr:unnamed protein product [Paramecium sonneborni]
MESLNEYVLQFIEQQRCHRHPLEKAKMIKLKCNFRDSFICTQCIENDSHIQMMSMKRASDLLTNFIKFDWKQPQQKTQQIKDKQLQFTEIFNNLLQLLETQINERDQKTQNLQKNYYQKLNEIERITRHLTSDAKIDTKIKDVNLMERQTQLSDNLKSSLLLLLQNDELLLTCNQKEYKLFNQKLDKRLVILDEILQDMTSQIQQQMDEFNQNMQNTSISRKLSNADPFTGTQSILASPKMNLSPSQRQLFISTFSSQLSKTFLNPFTFKQVHSQFKLISPTRLLVPQNQGNKTNKTRLALIGPRLQEGPLKPPKSITFSIQQQILQTFQIGVCETGSVELDPIKPHKLFFASKFPFFNRGDQLTLTVNPATGLIQLVKNKAFNQPVQAELQIDCWTNMVFVVASQDCGGSGEIHIIYDE